MFVSSPFFSSSSSFSEFFFCVVGAQLFDCFGIFFFLSFLAILFALRVRMAGDGGGTGDDRLRLSCSSVSPLLLH